MLGWVLFHRFTEASTFAQDQNSIVTFSVFGAASVVLEQPAAVAPPASTTQTSDTAETTLGNCAWRGAMVFLLRRVHRHQPSPSERASAAQGAHQLARQTPVH